MDQEYIRLIFGLKLKQIRTDKELSLFGLAKISGMSKSYLNEIEKGKKYPKPDKIAILADCLDVSYDELVSLKLEKNLAPIAKILESNFLKEIPFDLFGIQQTALIDIIAKSPAKVTAFISTIIEIARNYNFEKDNFYLASVRSYQEANHNFFPELELKVLSFAKSYQLNLSKKRKKDDLIEILTEEYGYQIIKENLDRDHHHNLRSVFVKDSNTLLISNKIDEQQELFIYAKEIGFNYLAIQNRLTTFPWIQFDSFEEVLTNFQASYFAGALLMPRQTIVSDLKVLFKKKEINPLHFKVLLTKYNTSPETLFQRLTNILPRDFGFKDLFFLRFNYSLKKKRYDLTKELHLSTSHAPTSNQSDEHYCRRWISLKVFNKLKFGEEENFGIQISEYPNHDESYLVISSATKDPFKEDEYRSISIGLPVNKSLLKKVSFTNSKIVEREKVGVTCERCQIQNCDQRQSPPIFIEKETLELDTIAFVKSLREKYRGGENN